MEIRSGIFIFNADESTNALIIPTLLLYHGNLSRR